MPEMPDTFECGGCHTDQPLSWLCLATSRGVVPWCLVCCGCDVHRPEDVEGTVIFAWKEDET